MGEDETDLVAFLGQFEFDDAAFRIEIVALGEAEPVRRLVDGNHMFALETAAILLEALGRFGGMGAEIVAQLLGQPCIADGDLSDCPPNVVELVAGLTG